MKNKQTVMTPDELAQLCTQGKMHNVFILFDDGGNVASIKLQHSDSRLRKNNVWHQTIYDELCEFVNDGLTYQQIGDLFGVSKSMVQYKINKLLTLRQKEQVNK